MFWQDEFTKVWNMTLPPGEMAKMHTHNYDYTFVVSEPSQLAVWGAGGDFLFEFRAQGSLSFFVRDQMLEPAPGTELPWVLPRTHCVKNIGDSTYREILIEHKATTNKTGLQLAAIKLAVGFAK